MPELPGRLRSCFGRGRPPKIELLFQPALFAIDQRRLAIGLVPPVITWRQCTGQVSSAPRDPARVVGAVPRAPRGNDVQLQQVGMVAVLSPTAGVSGANKSQSAVAGSFLPDTRPARACAA